MVNCSLLMESDQNGLTARHISGSCSKRSSGRRSLYSFAATCGLAWGFLSSDVQAGMPVPYLLITELGKRRLEEISFFFVGFLLLTAMVRWLWNGLAKDLPVLPKLSYRGALCFTILWGLALTVVLSLVSGARELMTPAAWEPNGITYRLAQSNSPVPEQMIDTRRERFLQLKASLWGFAAGHEGHFPSQISDIPEYLQVADSRSGLTYVLTANLSQTSPRAMLLQEPDIYPRRWALLTDGSLVEVVRESEATP